MDQVSQLRNSIILYSQIQKRMFEYLINKKTSNLSISNTEYLKCLNYVYNTITEATTPGQMKKKDEQKDKLKIQQKFFRIFLQDLTSFCSHLIQTLKSVKNSDAEYFLNAVDDQIRSYKLYMFQLFKIFRHLDGHYLKNNTPKKALHVQGAKIFKERYIEVIYQQLIQKIYQMLTRFKEGQNINNQVVARIILHIGLCGFSAGLTSIKLEKVNKDSDCTFKLDTISPYQTAYFKQKFISPIVQFIQRQYKAKSLDLLKLSSPEYVNQALKYLDIEQKTAKIFYDNEIPRKIIVKSTENILSNHNGRTVMDNQKTGVYSMLEYKKYDQLKKIYQLIKRSDHLVYLSNIFQKFIDKQGTQILDKITVQDQKQLKKQKISQMIHKLLELKELADNIVNGSFESDVKLQHGRDSAFHVLLNKSQKVTNFLCYYTDLQMKKQKIQSDQNSIIINQVLKLFRYLYSNDAFLKIYQKLLCMRILSDNFKNRDLQLQLISKLKSQAGASALNKISTMINDITNSEKFFNDYVKNNQTFNKFFQFKITILTTGSWPIVDPKTGKNLVPPQLRYAADKLQQLYASKFPGKGLTWIFSYGGGRLVTKFKENQYHLQVTGFQMLVLLMFDNFTVKELSLSQIYDRIKTEEMSALNASITQLIRLKILNKDGEQGKLVQQDKITFNQSFTYKNKRVNCILVTKYIQKPNVQLSEQIIKQRELVIDSIIVKVMKTRKVSKYEETINETVKLSKTFKADLGMIKRRLQALIERDFIKRDEKQSNMLIYIP